MNVKKLAIALASLVIIGLFIFAIIKFIAPNAMDYVNCALKSFLNPDGDSSGLGACASKINFKFK